MPSQEGIARSIAEAAHAGQVDRAGAPYILHPQRVASLIDGETAKAAAWLHDVVEDTALTFGDLASMGVSPEVLAPLRLLTHEPGVPYPEYIGRIKADPVAKAVKLADLSHNSDLSRLPTVGAEDERRAEKYRRAIEQLSS